MSGPPLTYTPASPNPDVGRTGSRPVPARQGSFLGKLTLSPLSSLSQNNQLKQSYENIVALANARETIRHTGRQALHHGRKIVWRDRGEPPVEVRSLEEAIEHAVRGASRAGGLGFAIRSGINIFLLLFRIARTPKNVRISLITHALFGPDSFRFAAMLGTFVGIYKFLINTLPIATLPLDFTPPLLPRTASGTDLAFDQESSLWSGDATPGGLKEPPHGRYQQNSGGIQINTKVKTKLSAQARAHEVWVRKKGRKWHAFLAGATAGAVAVLFEHKSRRLAIAQQMFVRGLQGTWNAYSTKHNIHVPYGAVWLFSLCCGQIMYGWLLRPDTIPRSYSVWISQASKVPHAGACVNRTLIRDNAANDETLLEMRSLIRYSGTTPDNRKRLIEQLRRMEASGGKDIMYPFGSCEVVHGWVDSCWWAQVDKLWDVSSWMFPIYGALHFVPSILFKRPAWVKNPLDMATRTLIGTARSSTFLGMFCVICLSLFCIRTNLYNFLRKGTLPLPLTLFLRRLITGRKFSWVAGFSCGLSLFVEAPRRRAELAMYVMPKAMEGAWIAARGQGLVWKNAGARRIAGDSAFTALAMGLVMSTYQNDPEHLSGLVRRVLYQFIGPN